MESSNRKSTKITKHCRVLMTKVADLSRQLNDLQREMNDARKPADTKMMDKVENLRVIVEEIEKVLDDQKKDLEACEAYWERSYKSFKEFGDLLQPILDEGL